MFAKLVAVSLLTLASSQLMAAECKTTIDSTDQMSFNTKEITIANDGIVNQAAVYAYATHSFETIEQLDRWGVKFEKDETGDYAVKKVHHMGAYVLPMVYGERFIGRAEAVPDRKSGVLRVRNIWYEDGVRKTKALRAGVERCMRRFAAFNDCAALEMPGGSPLEV